MERIVRKLESVIPAYTVRKKVAAYARVSSGKEAMLNSLSAQISYYSDYIQRNSAWEYAGVYADEAMTGTKDGRAEFQRLLKDCRDGKIDLVITKSISRFARNTVTMLEAVRELKNLNVDVFFEKENIHSISGDGELMLTILASFAQEESLSVSENCKWRIKRQFAEGIPSNSRMIGYRWIEGKFYILPEEAEIVRMIFTDYLNGMGRNQIQKKLNECNFKNVWGSSWTDTSIQRILRNEKFCGDMLLQKTYIKDHISKKKCINKGEVPRFYVEESHEPIIDRNTFEAVQEEINRRILKHHPSREAPREYPYTGKILCGQCGSYYRRKVNNAGTRYEKAVWICSTYNSLGRTACHSQQIPEDVLGSLVPRNFVKILVPAEYTLSIKTSDGETVETKWQHKSRKDSWTREMKIQARQKSFERRPV